MSKTGESKLGTGNADSDVLSRQVSRGEFSHAIIEMLATFEGKRPYETSFQLHDYVDGEALNTLLDTSQTDLEVTFTIEGYQVTVDGSGEVVCRPL